MKDPAEKIPLKVIVEGKSEAEFLNKLLWPHLYSQGVQMQSVTIGKGRHKGGRVGWERLSKDIKNALKGKGWVTTLYDFYGMESSMPGYPFDGCYTHRDKFEKACDSVVEKLKDDGISTKHLQRFIPYVQMYEFEALLYSEPSILAEVAGNRQYGSQIHTICSDFGSPEEINDDYHTCPSARLRSLFPGYQKPLSAILAAQSMSLANIREQCPFFDQWVTRLESLPQSQNRSIIEES